MPLLAGRGLGNKHEYGNAKRDLESRHSPRCPRSVFVRLAAPGYMEKWMNSSGQRWISVKRCVSIRYPHARSCSRKPLCPKEGIRQGDARFRPGLRPSRETRSNFISRGYVSAHQQKFDEALKDFNRASASIRKNPMLTKRVRKSGPNAKITAGPGPTWIGPSDWERSMPRPTSRAANCGPFRRSSTGRSTISTPPFASSRGTPRATCAAARPGRSSRNMPKRLLDLDEAIVLDPKNDEYYLDRGYVRELRHDLHAALANTAKASAAIPTTPGCTFIAATCWPGNVNWTSRWKTLTRRCD